ncbi:cupin [Streptomyces chilikensis]|uniref:Cupin n=1 Tax=Streptomyces chilikensis TaxID=1194079 RepID=A0ABV3EJF5_9ACTN
MSTVVEALPGTPLPHGILSGCFDVQEIPDSRLHELLGIEWLSLGCCPTQVWHDPCATDPPGAPVEKTFCRPTVERADPIHVYAGAECSTIGWSYAEARREALLSLELGQQRAIEEGFWRDTLAPNAVDLTPAEGPVPLVQGVAALEGALAETYGGRGVLHVPAGAAALLGCCQVAHREGDCLETLAGNQVTISAGASALNTGPDGLPAEPGSAWLAITGPVQVRLGPIGVVPDRAGASVDYRFNDLRVLVERSALVRMTCQPYMVRVTLCP